MSLAFIRHAFLKSSRRISDGYSFQGDELTKMIFKYDRGYELTQDDIEGFGCNSLNYDVPELNGDGYFSFTFPPLLLIKKPGIPTISYGRANRKRI